MCFRNHFDTTYSYLGYLCAMTNKNDMMKHASNRLWLWLLMLIAITSAMPVWAKQHSTRLIEAGLGYSSTSVNTTVFRNSSVVSWKGNQYIAYYDNEGYLVLGHRRLRDKAFRTQRTQYRGKVSDAHNVISLMVDGKGYLHVSFDHHGHPLHYCRSIAPGSLTLGEMEPMISPSLDELIADERDVTYPEFYRLKGGDLLFAYRSGASGRGNLVMNRYDVKTGRWSRIQDILIDGENQRNAYWQLFVDKKGTIHVSWVWRETWMVETNHDLCYACSKDNGRTWQRADGTDYSLPIRIGNAEVACAIPQESELINQTSMSTDSKGHPYIATYWRDRNDSVPQYRVVWHDGKTWHQQKVSQRQSPFTLKGGGTKSIPIARPRIAVNGNKAYYIVRDAERNSLVSMYYTSNLLSGQWQLIDLSSFSVHEWEPSIDTELWKSRHKLHIFVQDTHQGDGERTVASDPTPVYVMEVKSTVFSR